MQADHQAASTPSPVMISGVTSLGGSGFHFLTTDEAEFIDAAIDRFFPGVVNDSRGSRYVDCELHLAAVPCGGLGAELFEGAAGFLYRATIAETQQYCVQVYGGRFQDLGERAQDRVLLLLEEGNASCKLGQLQILFEMLLKDATEVCLATVFQEIDR